MNVLSKRISSLLIAAIISLCVGGDARLYARGGHSGSHVHGPSIPIYLVVDVQESTNADEFGHVLQKIKGTVASSNGHILIDSSTVSSLDGQAPVRYLVIQFDNAEKIKQWLASGDGKEFEDVRRKTTKSREFMVVGQPTEVGLALGGRSAARQEMMKIRDEEIKSLTSICKGC